MISFDPSNICDLTDEHSRTHRPVAVTEFERDGKHLYYINAHHVTGINNPTCETVRQAITRFNPDFVIVEGVETGKENGGFIAFVKEQAISGFKRGGENAFAAHIAIQKNIPFLGGEPPDETIFSGMKEKGYSAKDMLGFYLLRSIPQWRREDRLDENNFASLVKEHLNLFCQKANISEAEALTYEGFMRWFDVHNSTGKDLFQIDGDDLRPTNSENANFFQRLHHTMDPIREHHIDTVIANSFTEHDRVLVVYGDGHFVKSRPVFEKTFGHGTTLQLA